MVRKEEGSSSRRWSVAELLKWTEAYFRRLQLPTPRLDAEILLAHALGNSRLELYTGYQKLVEPDERARFRGFVERRADREPVAYITGRREFYSLSFEVSPAVLIPRPETEHLVEVAIEELTKDSSTSGSNSPPHFLDLCTGSGNVVIAVARNAPLALADAVDSSALALEVARRNAEAHGVSGRIVFFEGDLFVALPGDGKRYRAIVSNPPYIASGELEKLMDDVRLHEPREALCDSKSPEGDGLGFYRAIARDAGPRIEEHGLLAVEVGAGQADAVVGIFSAAGWKLERTVKDFGGIERVVAARLAK
jgi:release factor glutamine methyltransferase